MADTLIVAVLAVAYAALGAWFAFDALRSPGARAANRQTRVGVAIVMVAFWPYVWVRVLWKMRTQIAATYRRR